MKKEPIDLYLEWATKSGCAYLASGGPTTRLEDSLKELGKTYDLDVNVFATPTGLFVFCSHSGGRNISTFVRIRELPMNLSQLAHIEQIYSDLAQRRLSLEDAFGVLNRTLEKPHEYPYFLILLTPILMGLTSSFPKSHSWKAAAVSGLITFIVYWMKGPMASALRWSGFFFDFCSSLAALGLSTLALIFFSFPPESTAIGAFVYLVPGLTLTTSISELADNSFVSGTAKMMKAVLTLLAMGTAYLLFQDLISTYPHVGSSQAFIMNSTRGSHNLIALLCNIVLVSSFSIFFNVPRRALIGAVIVGSLSWMIQKNFDGTHYVVLSIYLSSLAVGCLSMILAVIYKIPSQTFTVPGILSLLPGMLALTAFRSFASGSQESGVELAFRVALITTTIVFGLLSARVTLRPFRRIAFKNRF